MGVVADLRMLYRLVFAPVRGRDHQERLEAFYRHQADGYDAFRRRLLHGREEMMRWLEVPPGGTLLDLGGGTGANVEHLGDRLSGLGRVTVVDLCPSMLAAARQRIERHGWANVTTALADVTAYEPDGPVDAVTLSYSLTMMSDWFAALERACALLRPGGWIGVVDFYISRKWPAAGMRRHGGLTRLFWPAFFSPDNVFLSPDHLPWLRAHFETIRLEERTGRVPYLPGLRAPYYIFIGRKT